MQFILALQFLVGSLLELLLEFVDDLLLVADHLLTLNDLGLLVIKFQ